MSTGSLSAEHLVFSVQPRQLALGVARKAAPRLAHPFAVTAGSVPAPAELPDPRLLRRGRADRLVEHLLLNRVEEGLVRVPDAHHLLKRQQELPIILAIEW